MVQNLPPRVNKVGPTVAKEVGWPEPDVYFPSRNVNFSSEGMHWMHDSVSADMKIVNMHEWVGS